MSDQFRPTNPWSRRDLLAGGLRLGLAAPALGALLAAAPVASAAPGARPLLRVDRRQDGGSRLTIIISSGTNDVDPHSTYSTIGSSVCFGSYEMLIQYKGESTSEYEPMLAESWEASPDNTTFTFKLPANVVFHDGNPCDAEAVKQSFVRFRRMERGPYNVISRFCDNPEEQIEVVDPTTVRFNLGQPQPLFLAAMASSYGPYVVSPAAWEANKTDEDPWAHEWLSFNAVGTGPYRLVENSPNERIAFERFEEFHGGWDGDHFDEIVMRIVAENATRRQLIEQGEADAATYNLTPEDVEALKSDPELNVLIYPTTRVNWAIMNAVKLPLQARQGFSYAFPYQEVSDGAYKGLIKRSGPIATTVKGADPEVFLYQTDLTKAKESILAAGLKEGDSFSYMLVGEDEIEKTVAQLFQANVQAMGFSLELEEVDNASYNDLIYGDSPAEERPHFMGAWAWWPDYNDPWNQLFPNFVEASTGGGGSNGGYWVNPRFEEIMAEAANPADEAQLLELMKEAQQILTELDPPVIYYGEAQYYTIIGKDIQGFYANPLYLEAYPFFRLSRVSA